MAQTASIKWQRGTFHKLRSLMKIRIGGGAVPVDIYEGDEFEYDGTILKYGGQELNSPQARGAFANGWIVPSEDDGGERRISSTQPTRNIAAAQSVNRDLSRVQRGSKGAISTSHQDEQIVLDVSERRGSENSAKPAVLAPRRAAVQRHASDEGVVIGEVRTKAKADFEDATKVSDQQIQAIEEGTKGQPILYKKQRTGTLEREGVTVKLNVSDIDPNSVVGEEDSDGVEIGRVRTARTTRSEGVTVEDTSSIRSRKPAPAKKAAAKPTPKLDEKLPPKIRIARAIDPSFPSDWTFSGKLADRLAAVKAHGATKQFVNALYAAEGDQMRKALEKAYPKYL